MAKLLVISPTPSHPQDAGNRARIFSLLSGLKLAGHSIFLAFVQMESGDEAAMANVWDEFHAISYERPADRWFKRLGESLNERYGFNLYIPYRVDDWYDPTISRELIRIQEEIKPDAVMVEYVFLSKAFECFQDHTLKILDTHDIFGGRHRLYLENGMTPQWFYTTVAEERKALDRADLILAIQSKEAAYFSHLTRRKVITVGHLVLDHEESECPEVDRLLFVGSGNPINIDSLKWFLDDIFPIVKRRIPGIELEVVGDCANAVDCCDGLILRGYVPDLAPYYRQAKSVINPVRFGTGLKIKTVEALAMGRPLVTTAAGAAGLEEWDGKAFLSGNTSEEFANKIIHVCTSYELRIKLIRNALALTQENNLNAIRPLIVSINQHLS